MIFLLPDIENLPVKNKQLINKVLQFIKDFIIYIYIHIKKFIIKEEKETFLDKFQFKYFPFIKFISSKITFIIAIISWFISVTDPVLAIFNFFRHCATVIGIVDTVLEFIRVRAVIIKFIVNAVNKAFKSIFN